MASSSAQSFEGSASERERILYALGFSAAKPLARFCSTNAHRNAVIRGALDAANGARAARGALYPESSLDDRLGALIAAANRQRLDRAAAEPGAERTASGLILKETARGSGVTPRLDDFVVVHFRGKLSDGSEYDSTYSRGTPATFGLRAVVSCWQEAFLRVKTGAHFVLTCPPGLAFGGRGYRPLIPPGEVLTFEIELISVIPGMPTGLPPTPTGNPFSNLGAGVTVKPKKR